MTLALFVAGAAVLVALTARASLKWPRPVLVGVTLSPILDRYLAPGVLAPEAEWLAHFLSEALLLVVGLTLVVQAARRGTLRSALSHPTLAFAAAFIGLAIASAVINGVPGTQALAGIAFTLDAVALFFLARVVGFDSRHALGAIAAVAGLVLIAAVIVIAQALLTPHLLGLSALVGRFGEVYRLAAFFGDPNTAAAFLSAAIPFALFGATGLRTQRRRRIALAGGFLMALALWLSFSRGGWLGAVGGFSLAAVILDHRALRIGLLVMAAALVVALAMPRYLICDTCDDRPDLFGSTFGRFGTIGEGRDLRLLFIGNALPIVADHPVLGVGPGRYGGAAADIFGTPIYVQYGTDSLFIDPSQRTVDDFWLHLVVESGVVGLLVYLAAVGAALRAVIHAARTAALGRRVALAGIAGAVACLSINALTTMLLEANSAAFLFWFLLGIGSQLTIQPGGDLTAQAAAAPA
ncbi:MAG TPA: O-antigen ligase family protein [Candidatus Limnocylindria bacterium]|nr:O-antigen ligase family protein [Candidatus Limnocylindria bacterium]